MVRPLKTLLFSTLYPSSARPLHGIFVETRLRELLKGGGIETRVVAPVPWFPSTHTRWGPYASFASTPRREERHDIDVLHPRYPLLPKVGMTTAPLSLAIASRPALRRLVDEGFDFDLIDAHYFYPDGVAAALLARHFRKPLVITARGSDLNVVGSYALPRHFMRWAAGCAQACIGVSAALTGILRSWDVDEHRLHVMRNGVDLQRFTPIDQAAARQQLGIMDSPVLLVVANLVPVKAIDLVIDALPVLRVRHPGLALYVVGGGPLRDGLQAQARRLGIESRVHLVGPVANELLPQWYSAADVSILASRSEGWANVLLESLACGTPVVATKVGGAADLLQGTQVGALVERHDPQAIAAAVDRMLGAGLLRSDVRNHARQYAWAEVSRAQQELFGRIVGGNRVVAPAGLRHGSG